MAQLPDERILQLFARTVTSVAKALSAEPHQGDTYHRWKRALTPKDRGGQYDPPEEIKTSFGTDVTLEEMRAVLTPVLEAHLALSIGATKVTIDW